MNRLATQPKTFNPPPATTDATFSLPLDKVNSFGRELAKRPPRPACRPAAFCPLHYERGYSYPLIVWLHGDGGTEHELRRVMPRISLRNYVGVAPRGARTTARQSAEGYTWSQDADGVELAGERVCDSIDFVQTQFKIASQRIFIAGWGVGGTMALRVAFEHPRLFAGAISIDGLLPRTGQPLRRVGELRQMPLLLSVRRNQPDCSESDLCRDLRLLHSAGMSVSVRQYAQDDAVLPLMLSDVDRWIMSLLFDAD